MNGHLERGPVTDLDTQDRFSQDQMTTRRDGQEFCQGLDKTQNGSGQ